MTQISDVLEQVRSYAPDADIAPVMAAYLLAAKAHAGQTRKSGEPYLTHPLEVAMILADLRMDVETISTALLHDALEDNPLSAEEMTEQVGPVITQLVDGVTKIGKLKFRSKEELQAENFRKMMLAMSRDVRVILVKLADRTHNMRTIEHHRPDKQKTIATETTDIFIPIANRLGITKLKNELEQVCFKTLEPDAWSTISEFLDSTQADRDEYIARTQEVLTKMLADEGIEGRVSGRAKSPFSIFRKMEAQNLSVEEVPDTLAFRVILPEDGQPYAVLGAVHARFAPVPGRIKDYIARPKPNGYQSLHTTIIGPEGRRMEIQIRTELMHRVAEEGIAAHWKYKEGHLALSPDDVAAISRIRELFETARDAESAEEFMETVKVELYADEVFVFTPAGDVKRLRKGATALDFAYLVHTDVGNHCVGARANGRMVPLRYELQSGDRLEILTSPSQSPNRDWLQICKTGRALQKVRRYLREEEKEAAVRLGREMLDSELKKYGSSAKKIIGSQELKEFLSNRPHRDAEQLFEAIARGQVGLSTVCKAVLPAGEYERQRQQAGTFGQLLNRWRRPTQSPVLITGEDGVLVTYAGCCNPLPGEDVVGFITRGRGITVHKAACSQLNGLDEGRQIPVEWDIGRGTQHSGQIKIFCNDRPGMLANITSVCEQQAVNILSAQASSGSTEGAVVTLDLSVRDVAELTRVIRNIEKIRGVEAVQRVSG
ncbi:MAG: bifunctional (p)ppGpp synthetase/guanosine-3',5'-bis(diphosphate) 3'-pyrophosphohydrolase [Deltaproteobacteria bacterium]|nr:MAG: bifunctional (p)ppGpp synthetase/guanosine-3',5'-bis(diphosphate) 3'-pyrophosphohydrolase [Deltaproteobacteria bacterium]